MNAYQQAAYEYFRESKLRRPNYEIKREEIDAEMLKEYKKVFVTVEFGYIGDEGTLVEALMRDIYLLTIGPRGGIKEKKIA